MAEGQARLEGNVGTLAEGQTRLEQQYKTIADAVGDLKRDAAIRATRNNAIIIAEDMLGLHMVHILTRPDLATLLRPIAVTVDQSVRMSFYAADMVMECKKPDDDSVAYIAVEASYTADRRDTDRVLRNAELLTQCTGAPAHPVVASVNNDSHVQNLVDKNRSFGAA